MADTRTYELTGTRVFRRDTHWGFVTNTGDPMFGSRSPNAALGVDRVRRVRRFRCGTSRVHRRGQIVPLLVNFPLRVGISRLVNSLKGVSSRRLRRSSAACAPTTAGQSAVVRGRTSQDRSTARITALHQCIDQQAAPP